MNSWLQSIHGAVAGLCLLGVALACGGCDTSGGGRQGITNRPGQYRAVTPPVAREPLPGPGHDIIRVGDKITVRLSDIPNPPEAIELRVPEDGQITLILDQKVTAAGKIAGQLETEIHDIYVKKFFNQLTVNVKSEERAFYVDGEVRKPDRYLYAAELTALKAIAVAQGFTEYAKKTRVEVTRINGGKPIIVDCVKAMRNPKLDIPIYPGDRIFVPRRIWL